jgi:hypothetical protein
MESALCLRLSTVGGHAGPGGFLRRATPTQPPILVQRRVAAGMNLAVRPIARGGKHEALGTGETARE